MPVTKTTLPLKDLDMYMFWTEYSTIINFTADNVLIGVLHAYAMVAFFTRQFFGEIVRHLNRDNIFTNTIKDFNSSMVLTCVDRGVSCKITARNGFIEVEDCQGNASAEFHFAATYSVWVSIAKGGVGIQGEVVRGRVKFRGSMPKMLLYLGKLAGMERLMIKLVNEIGTEF